MLDYLEPNSVFDRQQAHATGQSISVMIGRKVFLVLLMWTVSVAEDVTDTGKIVKLHEYNLEANM